MNTTWFEKTKCSGVVMYFTGQPSLEEAWKNILADYAIIIVKHLPTLAERCRWNIAEFARQCALASFDASGITGERVEALRLCAPVVDEHSALVVANAAVRAWEYYVVKCGELHSSAAYDAHHAALACLASDGVVAACHALETTADDPRLDPIARAAIPWPWVYDACAVDAPGLLDGSSK